MAAYLQRHEANRRQLSNGGVLTATTQKSRITAALLKISF
jgi:hypothetical protein